MNNGMKPLQRYDIELGDDGKWNSRLVIEESDDGNWVRDEDVKELEEQNKEMLNALKKLLPIAIAYESSYDEYVYLDTIFFAESVIARVEGEQE
jgi:hypothetical protein